MFKVITNHPVALDSRDHIMPLGTALNNWRNQKFNNKLYELFPPKQIRILDLGCAGGGFVKNCVENGHNAIGIEGSDFSLKAKRAEWATIPNRLFTADIGRPFQVVWEYPEDDPLQRCMSLPVYFDAITCWEVMEYIPKERLPALYDNIKKHLKENGLWIMSVSPDPQYHHVTEHDQAWWANELIIAGFQHNNRLVKHFDQDWVRGAYSGEHNSFHFIVTKK